MHYDGPAALPSPHACENSEPYNLNLLLQGKNPYFAKRILSTPFSEYAVNFMLKYALKQVELFFK